MKKSVIIIIAIVLLLAALFFTIPLFFKPALINSAKSTLNEKFNVKVEFADFKISMFRNFPKVAIELKKVTVSGKNEFENDTLLSIENVRVRMSLMSLFKKTERSIDEINLVEPKLTLIVGKTGNENWNVTTEKSSEPANSIEGQTGKQEEPFALQLEKIKINNATIIYTDREINLVQIFKNVNLEVKGKMFGSSTDLLVVGYSESYSVDYKGVRYISDISLETKSLLKIDYEKMDIAITGNELLVNRLPIRVTGLIQMPADSTFFDLTLKTKYSGFENFLALVPPGYEDYLKKIKTSGSASVSGIIKGFYFDKDYPAIDLKIEVANGNFKYVDLPEEIKNIKADISLTKPQGDLDFTEVQIKNAHIEIKNNPVDLTLKLKTPFSDLYFDGAFVGTVNFDQLKNALPLDSVNVSGTIDANLFVKGNYSSIEKEQYDKIKSDGIVLLDNFLYDSPHLTRKILVPSGKLDFSPTNVNLSQFNMKVGQSDFKLTGKVFNYLNYIFKDGTLQGDLQLASSFVNLNELFRLQKKEKTIADDNRKPDETIKNSDISNSTEKLVFDVPKNIDFTFRSNIDRALFDQLSISDITGLITAKNGKLILNGLDMNMLDGNLKLTGSYENNSQNQPFVDFGLEAVKFDIPTAFQSLSGLQKMAPVAGQSQGKISANMKMKGQLTQAFKIIPSSVDGAGFFNTENLQITDSPVFKQLKGILKSEKLNNITVDDFKASFVVENGNIDLKPFKTKVAGQETTVLGTLSAENLLNMRLDFMVNRDAFGNDIENILSVIPGNQKIDRLPAGVIINGPVEKPEVKLDLEEARKTVANAAKGELKNTLDQLGKGLKKLFEK